MNFRVEAYVPDRQMSWDGLVARSRNGIFQFARGYMDYHADRFTDFSFLVWKGDKLVAAMPASIDRDTATATSHAGLTFGGLVVDASLRSDEAMAALDLVLGAMREDGARNLSIKLLPSFLERTPSAEAGYALWKRGFHLVRRDLSSVLPLGAAPTFNSSKKQAIAKARKVDFGLGEGALGDFHALLTAVLEERHDTAPVHRLDELERLQRAFPDRIHVVGAHEGDRMIAGALLFRYDTAWHTQYLASSERGREAGALDIVIATAIDAARSAGVPWFSFGISTTNAGRDLNAGLLWQKESFGARAVVHDVMAGDL